MTTMMKGMRIPERIFAVRNLLTDKLKAIETIVVCYVDDSETTALKSILSTEISGYGFLKYRLMLRPVDLLA